MKLKEILGGLYVMITEEEEDLLKEMMKIQKKNNDRHAINYNLLK